MVEPATELVRGVNLPNRLRRSCYRLDPDRDATEHGHACQAFELIVIA